jgi:alpha-mannosidase
MTAWNYVGVRISSVVPTELFGGTARRPLQLIWVTVAGDRGSGNEPGDTGTVAIAGPGVSTPFPAAFTAPDPGAELLVEVGVEVAAPYQPGSVRHATVIAELPSTRAGVPPARAEAPAEITTAEPGWTMWMVSHFHYDPVWWNTQGQFTESRLLLPDSHGNLPDVRTAFELVTLHLDAARRDPDYKFVLAEIDYLKPHFDAHPEDREDLRRFIAEGRIEMVGGSYNEPNTNLTGAESTIRNAIYGIGYQRDVLGADPRSAWMLDSFGHDPGYPGLMAAAGLTSSAWARGPFHQWGPSGTVGSNERMEFASEFEWISPDGGSLLTSYMPNHYGAGWVTHQAPDLQAAELAAWNQFRQLAPVAATRNVMLPVGADHVIPSRWVTGIHRSWNARYVWPRFVTAVPSEFFAAVRADADASGAWITPQSRDMNPLYPGKDVSYIDTKQAQRAGETAVTDGERLATLAWLASAGPAAAGAPGYRYPAEPLDKAWRQLLFGAHHDAITGTESDQVYLDLLGGWREAWQLGHDVRQDAAGYLAGLVRTGAATTAAAAVAAPPAAPGDTAGAVVVFNTLSRPRSSMASVRLQRAGQEVPSLADEAGQPVPCLATAVSRGEDGGIAAVTLTFRAADVPALGYRTYRIVPGAASQGWQPADGMTIENERFLVTADPGRGGGLATIRDKRHGAGLLADGAVGNELLLQEEYPTHPRWNEGQWLLSPKGAGRGSSAAPARVRAERCPVGSRLVAEFTDGDLRITQETVLWDGADRIEFATHVDGSIGQDRLLRVRFPADVPGGLPVYQTATAVVGRPPGWTDTDVANHWFTLDNPANEWFGVGSTARVAVRADDGRRVMQAIGVAEVITPVMPNGASQPAGEDGKPGPREEPDQAGPGACRAAIRDLIAALAGQGVTATCSRPDGPRYGAIDLDSNLPDFRITLGRADENPFTAEVLAAADPAFAKQLSERLQLTGSARIWVPASRPRDDVFVPGADARGTLDLPVLIVAGNDLRGLPEVIAALSEDLADSVIEADGPAYAPLADRSVALLNKGTPGCVVTPDGTLNISLMRASSAWPAGVWLDGEKRAAPDGSSFNWQHWTHTFEYALAAGPGDWRTAGFAAEGEDYNRDLVTCATGLHDGPLPARASLLSVDPPAVALTALKPRGNPLASGRPGTPDPADGVLVRLLETAGRPATARVRLPAAARGRRTDLLEEADGGPLPADDGAVTVDLPPAGVVSLVLRPGPAAGQAASTEHADQAPGTIPGRPPRNGPVPRLRATEIAQPVYTRYWLHGKGPAPAGNLPVAVHVRPGRTALEAGGSATLQVTVGCGLEPAAGEVELDVPPGLAAGQDQPLRFDLPPGGHAAWDVTVRATPKAAAGRYFVAARISDQLGQQLEDTALLTVGEPPSPDLSLPLDQVIALVEADQQAQQEEIGLEVLTPSVGLAPGQRGELAIRLTNRAASQLRGEAQLVSPFGSWEALGQWTYGFGAGPGMAVTVTYPVTMPAGARPGAHWWAVVKVMYFGRVRYSEAVPVTVTG